MFYRLLIFNVCVFPSRVVLISAGLLLFGMVRRSNRPDPAAISWVSINGFLLLLTRNSATQPDQRAGSISSHVWLDLFLPKFRCEWYYVYRALSGVCDGAESDLSRHFRRRWKIGCYRGRRGARVLDRLVLSRPKLQRCVDRGGE